MAPDSEQKVILRRQGLVITRPSLFRMLAWKLDRWADDLDIEDARVLLREIMKRTPLTRPSLQRELEKHLPRGGADQALYNLDDLADQLSLGS